MKMPRILTTCVALVASSASMLPAASAAPSRDASPTVEHFVIDAGPFHDDILTPACGFDVSTTISARGVDLVFENGQPSGLLFLSTFRNLVTFSANGRSVIFNERGHESVRLQRGVIIDATSGRNFGLGTIGRFVFRVDPSTGEVLSTSMAGRPIDLAPLCAALSA